MVYLALSIGLKAIVSEAKTISVGGRGWWRVEVSLT